MDLSFTHLPDGVIEISVGRSDGLFTMAMNDSVSSRAPRGSATPGLSTYWIDRVEAAAQSAREHRSAEPFASGNVTYLRLDGDEVIAAFDFDPAEIDARIDAVGVVLASATRMARSSDRGRRSQRLGNDVIERVHAASRVSQFASFTDREAERIGNVADASQARSAVVGRLVSLDLLLGDAEGCRQIPLAPLSGDAGPAQGVRRGRRATRPRRWTPLPSADARTPRSRSAGRGPEPRRRRSRAVPTSSAGVCRPWPRGWRAPRRIAPGVPSSPGTALRW